MGQERLVAGLFLWALFSLGTAIIGLYGTRSEVWRSFWLMSGLWGLIDGAIAWYGMVRPAVADRALAPILKWNAMLDVFYLLLGVVLILRKNERLRGSGWGVLTQGAFLLGFDVYFWRLLEGLAG